MAFSGPMMLRNGSGRRRAGGCVFFSRIFLDFQRKRFLPISEERNSVAMPRWQSKGGNGHEIAAVSSQKRPLRLLDRRLRRLRAGSVTLASSAIAMRPSTLPSFTGLVSGLSLEQGAFEGVVRAGEELFLGNRRALRRPDRNETPASMPAAALGANGACPSKPHLWNKSTSDDEKESNSIFSNSVTGLHLSVLQVAMCGFEIKRLDFSVIH